MKPIPPVKPGDPIDAALYNAIAERLEQKLALTVAQGGGLTILKTPRGRVLGLTIPRPIWAQLSGTSSPYSWQEVESVSGGTWATFGQRSGTSNAYECNGKGSLNGKVVQLWKTSAGDWRFCYEGVGCNPATTGVKFTVNGCQGSPLQGATVTVTQGSNTYTCTTDANGQCTIGLSSTASYTYTVSYSSRLTTASGGPSTPHCGTIANVTVSLSAASGYVCCSNSYAYPTTLYLTTSGGTFTLVYNSSSSIWTGSLSVAVSNVVAGSDVCVGSGNPCSVSGAITTGSGNVDVTFYVYCTSGQIEEGWPCVSANCNTGPTCYPLDHTACTMSYAGCSGLSALGAFNTALPLPQTVALPTANGSGATCAPPVTGSGTLSE